MVATVITNKQLSAARPGVEEVVSHYTNDSIGGKLMSMGILPGSRVALVRRAPFGGGWYVKVDNIYIALRMDEASSVVLK
ncbi:MAG: ferrous iron transport protein A [Phaeodactylibacter sp.]|nr:ferrous iron transport protein A [Phaeodactylibacter sp.]MCB9263637.1 ferrous iron transport protein A [Lewinellaceae bacterium]MCB9287484.1 ferrous iron transport protein A [Lewinellaceae bacterium]